VDFQTVQHDVWDRDIVVAPTLITVNVTAKDVDAVEIATKSGYVWLFDRHERHTVCFRSNAKIST